MGNKPIQFAGYRNGEESFVCPDGDIITGMVSNWKGASAERFSLDVDIGRDLKIWGANRPLQVFRLMCIKEAFLSYDNAMNPSDIMRVIAIYRHHLIRGDNAIKMYVEEKSEEKSEENKDAK